MVEWVLNGKGTFGIREAHLPERLKLMGRNIENCKFK